jgi:hypothetical protein
MIRWRSNQKVLQPFACRGLSLTDARGISREEPHQEIARAGPRQPGPRRPGQARGPPDRCGKNFGCASQRRLMA